MILGEVQMPDAAALHGLWRNKVDDDVHAPPKGRVDIFTEIGCKERDPAVVFETLQQVVGFEVGVPIVGRPNSG